MANVSPIDPIDFRNLADAKDYYANLGYREVVAPWTVTEGAYAWTSPPGGVASYEVAGRLLVASAEQSFIEMMGMGALTAGKFQATTPCFRDEGFYTRIRLPYFMKLELIEVLALTGLTRYAEHILNDRAEQMAQDALEFFSRRLSVHISETNDKDKLRASKSYDILSSGLGIELGSYGCRKLPSGITWVYGTGVAEPRLSVAIQMEKQNER